LIVLEFRTHVDFIGPGTFLTALDRLSHFDGTGFGVVMTALDFGTYVDFTGPGAFLTALD
jgi:hypothetical protein